MTSFNFRFDQEPRRSKEEEVFFFKENQENDISSADNNAYFSTNFSANNFASQPEDFHNKSYGRSHEPRLGALSPVGHPKQFSQLRPYSSKSQNDLHSLSFWHNEKVTEEDIESTPSPLKLIIAVTGLAIMCAISWFTYKWIRGPVINNALLIKADPSPYKVKPESPGGINIPHQDKLIYGMITNDGTSQQQVEHFLPPEQLEFDDEQEYINVNRGSSQNIPAQNVPKQNIPAQNIPVQNPYNPQQNYNNYRQEAVPQTQPVAGAEKSAYMIQPPNYEVNRNQEPQNLSPNQQNAQNYNNVPTSSSVSEQNNTVQNLDAKGNFYVQLATVASDDAAIAEWSRLSRKYNLGGYNIVIKGVDLGKGKKNYRLLMGPFPSQESADKQAAGIEKAQVVQINP